VANTIRIKRRSSDSTAPTTGQVVNGELALNESNDILYYGKGGNSSASSSVLKIGGPGAFLTMDTNQTPTGVKTFSTTTLLITGGSNGNVLTTNGSGTLSWSAMSDLTSNLVTMATTQTITGTKTFSAIATFTEHVVVGGKKELRLADSDSSNYVALTSPTTVSNNNVYTLPSAVGSANQVLQIASVAGNDATLQWATVSGGPGGSDTQVQFNDSSSFGGDAGLTYNKTTDSLTIAGDLAVNGGDITTSASTFNIVVDAATVNIATNPVSAHTLNFGSSVSGSVVNLFDGAAQATYTLSKAYNSLFFTIDTNDFGFEAADTLMGYGGTGITSIGDWTGNGNGTYINVNDGDSQIAFNYGAASYLFPTDAGSAGQVLTTDGSSTLSWATPSAGTKTYAVFTPLDNQPPATNFATIDTRNSIMVLDFADSSADESAIFVGVIPEGASLGSGLKVRIRWMATTATSGVVRWGAQFMNLNTDCDSDSFDTATEGNTTTNATSGTPNTTELTVTNIDGLAAGDFFRLKIYREQSDTANDTMTGDAELIAVEVRSAS